MADAGLVLRATIALKHAFGPACALHSIDGMAYREWLEEQSVGVDVVIQGRHFAYHLRKFFGVSDRGGEGVERVVVVPIELGQRQHIRGQIPHIAGPGVLLS